MKLFIGASSSEVISNDYIDDCKQLLEAILKENDLVFGASNKGLMGTSYEIAKNNNRSVTGICPEVYKDSLKYLSCDKEEVTASIIDSTMKIYNNCDAIIFLPGGFGSLFEFFTANYCKICNDINIPIIIYNSLGYYDKLISFIEDIYNKGFIREKELGNYYVANSREEALSFLDSIKGE